MYNAARAAEINAATSPRNDLNEICKSTPDISNTPEKLTNIPNHALDGIWPPLILTKSAAKIGCKATSAVPAATVVQRIAKKKPIKCIAKRTPATAAHLAPLRLGGCFNANGKVNNEPPKLRQKIKVAMGIVLRAINGPEVPIPIIPRPKRIRSGLAGMAV